MKRIIERLDQKALDLAGIEVEPLPDITAEDAERVLSYPLSVSHAVAGTTREFGDGLMQRLAP